MGWRWSLEVSEPQGKLFTRVVEDSQLRDPGSLLVRRLVVCGDLGLRLLTKDIEPIAYRWDLLGMGMGMGMTGHGRATGLGMRRRTELLVHRRLGMGGHGMIHLQHLLRTCVDRPLGLRRRVLHLPRGRVIGAQGRDL